MQQVFAPGCALMLYKPELAKWAQVLLQSYADDICAHDTCCRFEPILKRNTRVINVCPGCDRRYRCLYDGISTISLWEVLAKRADFPFPDYGGITMTVHDACPTRTQQRVHSAVRTLLERMNIGIVEPRKTKTKAVCCGDSFFGKLPTEQIETKMRERAMDMPCENVVVYCVSCIKSLYNGDKTPRYLLDLLFGETTQPKVHQPDAWHAQLDAYIQEHQG